MGAKEKNEEKRGMKVGNKRIKSEQEQEQHNN
jgi:hypothetical protein